MEYKSEYPTATLNRWAAEFLGEDRQGVATAMRTSRYTSSIALAAVVFAKSIERGVAGEIHVDPFGEVEVRIHGVVATGTRETFARTILEAAYSFDIWCRLC
jgi:hypothetical protein